MSNDVVKMEVKNWLPIAIKAVQQVASGCRRFTADDVWPLVPAVVDPKAMGRAILAAKRDGLISPTPQFVTSRRWQCKWRPVRAWRSM